MSKSLLNCASTLLISAYLVACSSNQSVGAPKPTANKATGSPVYVHMKKGKTFTGVSNSRSNSEPDSEAFRLYPDGQVTPVFSSKDLSSCNDKSVDKYGKLCGSYFVNWSVTAGSLVGTAVAAALTSGITLLGGVGRSHSFNKAGFDQAVKRSNVKAYAPMIVAFKARSGAQPFSFSKETLHIASAHPSGSTNYLLSKMLEQNKSVSALETISNPNDKQIMAVLKANPSYIGKMSRPRDKFQRFVVSNSAKNIQFIKKPAEHIQLMAVEKDVNTFNSITSPTQRVIAYALGKKGDFISKVKNPSAELQRIAITQNALAIKHIKSPSVSLQMLAVRKNPKAIDEISKPSEDAQLYVLKTKGASFLHDYVTERSMAPSVLKNPEMVRYLGAYKGAAKRRSSSSYSSSSGGSSYSSSGSSSSGSSYTPPPAPVCRNVRYTTMVGGHYQVGSRRECN